jgi:hypothetical protein
MFKGFGKPQQTQQPSIQTIAETGRGLYEFLKLKVDGDKELTRMLSQVVMKFTNRNPSPNHSSETNLKFGRICTGHAVRNVYHTMGQMELKDILTYLIDTPFDDMKHTI